MRQGCAVVRYSACYSCSFVCLTAFHTNISRDSDVDMLKSKIGERIIG